MAVQTCSRRRVRLYDPVIQQTGGPVINTPGPEVAFVDISAINVPKRREDISVPDLADLAATIKGGFLRHPIVLTPQHLLLDGERRMRAALLAGRTHIQAYIVYSLKDASELMAAALADKEYQIPLTYTEICRSMDVLTEWSRDERAALKAEAGRRAAKARMGDKTAAKGRLTQHARDYISTALGVSGGSLGRLVQIWRLTKSDDPAEVELAHKAMANIDSEGSISRHLTLLRTGRVAVLAERAQNNGKARRAATLPRIELVEDPATQRKILANAAVALNGINIGLAQVSKATGNDIPKEELERIVDALTTTRRLTTILLRQINAGGTNEGGKK